ncbi:MAG TPA: hypothetical protein VGF97_00520 [Rhizomicrobium sp.]|jgi:hypothetical protein
MRGPDRRWLAKRRGHCGVSGNGEIFGFFYVLDHDMAMTFHVPALGQNYGLVFVAHAAHGKIGGGILDYVQGGEPGDTGVVSVGRKNSC